jgi:predicted GIY-YIG superfamily endonuclease
MAIISTDVAARIRLADHNNKTFATFSKVDPKVTPNNVGQFADAVSALSNDNAIIRYVIVETELSDDGE